MSAIGQSTNFISVEQQSEVLEKSRIAREDRLGKTPNKLNSFQEVAPTQQGPPNGLPTVV